VGWTRRDPGGEERDVLMARWRGRASCSSVSSRSFCFCSAAADRTAGVAAGGLALMFGHRLVAAPWAWRHAPGRVCGADTPGGRGSRRSSGRRALVGLRACGAAHRKSAGSVMAFLAARRVPIALGIFVPLVVLIAGSLAAAQDEPLFPRPERASVPPCRRSSRSCRVVPLSIAPPPSGRWSARSRFTTSLCSASGTRSGVSNRRRVVDPERPGPGRQARPLGFAHGVAKRARVAGRTPAWRPGLSTLRHRERRPLEPPGQCLHLVSPNPRRITAPNWPSRRTFRAAGIGP